MRRNGMTLREVLVLIVVLFGVGGILFPLGHPGVSRRARERHQCQTNLKQVALAIKQYVQDANEHFPHFPSLRTTKGWREAITPYVKNAEIFHCPSEGDDQTQTYCDYWFNARLSGAGEELVEFASSTLLLGDGYSSGDPRVSLSQLPQSWRDDEKSPAWRHLDGANYAFVDGHVKWFRPDKISTLSPRQNSSIATFAVR